MKHCFLILIAFLCSHAIYAEHLDTLGITIEIDSSVTICQGEEFMGYDEPGIYVDTEISNDTCTVTTLELNLYDPTPDVWELMCIEENDPNYTESTTTTTLYDSNGCEYLHTTQIRIKPADIITDIALCDGSMFILDGIVIDTSGDYVFEKNDMGLCPYNSILRVTVYPASPDIITNAEICEGESYSWYNNFYFSAGTYIQIFKDPNGCDYEEILNLSVLPQSDTNCTTSTKELEAQALSLYPVPASDIINIEYQGTRSLSSYKCYKLNGALVLSGELSNNKRQSIAISELTEGMYLMRLLFADGQEMDKRVVIIR